MTPNDSANKNERERWRWVMREKGTGDCVCSKLLGQFNPLAYMHNVDQNKEKSVSFQL